MINSLYPKYYLDMAPNGDDYGGGEDPGEDTSEGGGGEYDAPQDVTDIGVTPPPTPSPLTMSTTTPTVDGLPIDTTYIPPVSTVAPSTKQKEIRSVIIKDKTRDIDPNGEIRSITIKGDEGAGLTLTVTTPSGCNVLEDEIENFQLPSSGKHQVNVKFPRLDASVISETFTLEILPTADTTSDKVQVLNDEGKELSVRTPNVERTTKLYQYKNPTVTFTNTSTQTSPALTVSGSDVTKTGKAKTFTEEIYGYTSTTYTLTIVENPTDTAGYLYVKGDLDFNNNITNDKTIKKVVRRETSGEATSTKTLRLDPSTTMTDSDGIITGDLVQSMKVTGCVSYTKTVFSSVGTDNCYLPVDQFKLDNTNNLFEGMIVSGRGIYGYPVTITSIDCNDSIVTLSSKYVIRDGAVLTFEHCVNTSIRSVETNIDSEGKACITIGESVVPDLMELSFTEDNSIVEGTMKQSGSGSNTVTITTELDVIKFGEKDITQTLNLDNFITTTPNAFDQDVLIKKDTATGIFILTGDSDANISDKTVTVTANPSHGKAGSWSTTAKTITYTPHTGFIGLDSFAFTVSDGTNSSKEKKVFITVN